MYKNYVILIYNVHELQFTFSFIFHLLIVPTEIWPIRNIYTCSNILLIINLHNNLVTILHILQDKMKLGPFWSI